MSCFRNDLFHSCNKRKGKSIVFKPPWVNFISILRQLLRLQIPKAQKDSKLKQLFALLGSEVVKAVHKHIDQHFKYRQAVNNTF